MNLNQLQKSSQSIINTQHKQRQQTTNIWILFPQKTNKKNIKYLSHSIIFSLYFYIPIAKPYILLDLNIIWSNINTFLILIPWRSNLK